MREDWPNETERTQEGDETAPEQNVVSDDSRVKLDAPAPGKEGASQVDGQPGVPGENQYVDLPTLISGEFGTPASTVRLEIALGEVYVDGEKVTDNRFSLRRNEILDKQISIEGPHRQFKLTYRG